MSRQHFSRQHLRHHRIEELERRQLMAGDVNTVLGNIWINGSQQSDVAEVSYDATGSLLVVNLNGQTQLFNAAGIQKKQPGSRPSAFFERRKPGRSLGDPYAQASWPRQ